MSTKSLKMLFKPFILPFYFIGEIEEKRPGGGEKRMESQMDLLLAHQCLSFKMQM